MPEPSGHTHGSVARSPKIDNVAVLYRGYLSHGATATAIADDMDENVDSLCDVARDGVCPKLTGAREQQREPDERTDRGPCMNRRQRSLVSGAQRLEEG